MRDTDRLSSLIAPLLAEEQARFVREHPQSMTLSAATQPHFLFGVPLHWMCDWPTPSTLFMQSARDVTLVCADGHQYSDFCLGDTGAMFGHSPAAVSAAIAEQAAQGLTSMLPSTRAPAVGKQLAQRFGLPLWQLAMTASDANRFVLRWARAATQRSHIVVFDGCYHGAVDDTLVDRDPHTAATVPRPSVLGQVHNHHLYTRVIPFNDLDALSAALADEQVAVLLAEPALTNCGLVPPQPGFWAAAQALCRQYGTLLVLDETHTLSSGPGGYAQQHGLRPDGLVIGKAIAGGMPCAVYGFSAHAAQRTQAAKTAAPVGHSGIGTTLTANALTLAALDAALQHLHTDGNYQTMLQQAQALESGLIQRITAAAKPWTVTRIGARLELQFMPHTPVNAQTVRALGQPALESFLHLFMLNRGVLLTPFHSMMLCSPQTQPAHVDQLLTVFDAFLSVCPA